MIVCEGCGGDATVFASNINHMVRTFCDDCWERYQKRIWNDMIENGFSTKGLK